MIPARGPQTMLPCNLLRANSQAARSTPENQTLRSWNYVSLGTLGSQAATGNPDMHTIGTPRYPWVPRRRREILHFRLSAAGLRYPRYPDGNEKSCISD